MCLRFNFIYDPRSCIQDKKNSVLSRIPPSLCYTVAGKPSLRGKLRKATHLIWQVLPIEGWTWQIWSLRLSFILGGSQSQRLCLGDVPKHTLESQVHSKGWHKEEKESKQRPRTSLSAKVLLGKVLANLTLIGHTLDTLTAPHTFQPLLSHCSE